MVCFRDHAGVRFELASAAFAILADELKQKVRHAGHATLLLCERR